MGSNPVGVTTGPACERAGLLFYRRAVLLRPSAVTGVTAGSQAAVAACAAMNRLTVVIAWLALACGSGARTQSSSSSSAEADLTAALAQSGLRCAPHEPPKVQARVGKQA